MLDVRARAALSGPLGRVAAMLDRPAVTPNRLTALGMLTGLASAGSAAAGWWPAAAVLWLLSRLADGLDGPLARRRGTASSGAGGFLDISADFLVYGAFVVGVAVGVGGPALPFLLVLLAYYVNGTVFLAFSSIAERTGRRSDDRRSGGRSLNFLGGLAEGGETIAVHTLWCLLPGFAHTVAWVWAAAVGVTAAHRVVTGYRQLR